MRDLQKEIPNTTKNHLPPLNDLANAYIGTTLDKKDSKVKDLSRKRWGESSLSLDRTMYTALDARLGYENTRKHRRLVGYNSYGDYLNAL